METPGPDRIRALGRSEERLGAARVPRGGSESGGAAAAGSLGGSAEGWEEYYDPEKNPRLDPEQVYVVEEDGDIRATTAALPMEVFVDEKPVLMEGIADVAIHPAYRWRGCAGELMHAALGGMWEQGIHFSMLYIPSPTFSTTAMAGN